MEGRAPDPLLSTLLTDNSFTFVVYPSYQKFRVGSKDYRYFGTRSMNWSRSLNLNSYSFVKSQSDLGNIPELSSPYDTCFVPI